MTVINNKWQRVLQQVKTGESEWQQVVTLANFRFLRIREEPTTKHPKENTLNTDEDLEKDLLKQEEKQASKKKHQQ